MTRLQSGMVGRYPGARTLLHTPSRAQYSKLVHSDTVTHNENGHRVLGVNNDPAETGNTDQECRRATKCERWQSQPTWPFITNRSGPPDVRSQENPDVVSRSYACYPVPSIPFCRQPVSTNHITSPFHKTAKKPMAQLDVAPSEWNDICQSGSSRHMVAEN